MTETCYCLSKRPFAQCCQAFLEGQAQPNTAEQLMRSRYSAHATGNTDYLLRSLATEKHGAATAADTLQWVDEHDWLGLQIIQSRQGQAHHKAGTVEFIAYYRPKGDDSQRLSLHEKSNFERRDGRWVYVDGYQPKGIPTAVGRNDPCPCGSGKKFKKCCI